MQYIRMFIAGFVLPSLAIPFLLLVAVLMGRSHLLEIPFLHFIPLIWGFWNIFHRTVLAKSFPGNPTLQYLITGAILGLIVAVCGIWAGITEVLNISFTLPLLFLPFLYAILWAFVVEPLNGFLGVKK